MLSGGADCSYHDMPANLFVPSKRVFELTRRCMTRRANYELAHSSLHSSKAFVSSCQFRNTNTHYHIWCRDEERDPLPSSTKLTVT